MVGLRLPRVGLEVLRALRIVRLQALVVLLRVQVLVRIKVALHAHIRGVVVHMEEEVPAHIKAEAVAHLTEVAAQAGEAEAALVLHEGDVLSINISMHLAS